MKRLVVGPPGTGKTWWISNKIKELVEEKGIDPRRILVASLTKAAAKEATGRHGLIPSDNIGTIHSFCYHALKRPEIAESYKWIKEWNAYVKEFNPEWKLSPSSINGFVDVGVTSKGDELLNRINIRRAKHQDPAKTEDIEEKRFYEEWIAFKEEYNLLDFTDLIETAIKEVVYPPNQATIIFVDEAQDISRLEYKLLLSWAVWGSDIYFVGDKLQSLFTWRGAVPDAVEWSKYSTYKLLDKSYRLPDKIKKYSLNFINKYFDEILEYMGSGKEGNVYKINVTYNYLEPIYDILMKLIKSNETIMLLAPCSYMVNEIATWLKSKNILYHNPYTHRWNSLSQKSLAFHLNFLMPKYLKKDFSLSNIKYIFAGLRNCLKRGVKKEVKELEQIEDLKEFIKKSFKRKEDYKAFMKLDEEWFIEHGGNKDALEIVKKAFTERISLTPKVIIGTIHSVKGGEADNVFLFPDLSMAGFMQTMQEGFYGIQAVAMMFYVGMTRAKKRLFLCQPSSGKYFSL